VSSFLAAYQHLATTPLSPQECDQYIEEMATVGHLLGGVDLPLTLASVNEQLNAFMPELEFDHRAKEILELIQAYPTDFLDKPFMTLVLKAAFDVMPAWIMNMLGKDVACALQIEMTKRALQLTSEPLQWMLNQQGVSAIARQRASHAA
jgi:uncharacterized protein (DUF2236 family)